MSTEKDPGLESLAERRSALLASPEEVYTEIDKLKSELSSLILELKEAAKSADNVTFEELVSRIERIKLDYGSKLENLETIIRLHFPERTQLQKLALAIIALYKGSMRDLDRYLGGDTARRKELAKTAEGHRSFFTGETARSVQNARDALFTARVERASMRLAQEQKEELVQLVSLYNLVTNLSREVYPRGNDSRYDDNDKVASFYSEHGLPDPKISGTETYAHLGIILNNTLLDLKTKIESLISQAKSK